MPQVHRISQFFLVDSYVLARYTTQPPTRLHTLWRGPFQVVSIHNSDYTLLDITTKKHKHLHISHLEQFVFNPKHTDPADVARRDYMEFFIESIIQHQGNSRRKTQMRFLVKWTDFDDSHNTWEPWKNLHTYLRLHGMSKIIPTEKQVPQEQPTHYLSKISLHFYNVALLFRRFSH